MANIEKLMNEHLLSDLKTQWILRHSDVNMTFEINRKTFLKVGKNTVDVLTWCLLSLVQKAEVHLTETFKLNNVFATIKNIAQYLSNNLLSNKENLQYFISCPETLKIAIRTSVMKYKTKGPREY